MANRPKQGDVVLITGCSDGGIGAALCLAFHEAGCNVFATARRLESMASLRQAGLHTLVLDVSCEQSVKKAVEAVLSEAGRIDILVNNAGMGLVAPVVEVDIQKAQELFDANYWGTLRMIQAVAPHMTARRSGLICNVGSVVGFLSTPWGAMYCASKAAVHSLTDALRLELHPFGVKVVLLAPGAVKSNIGVNNLKRFDDKYVVYAPFAEVIRERATLSQVEGSMPTDVFARGVVCQLLRRHPPAHYLLGGFVRLMRFVMWWPLWMRDRLLVKTFKVDLVKLPPLPPPSAVDSSAVAKKAL